MGFLCWVELRRSRVTHEWRSLLHQVIFQYSVKFNVKPDRGVGAIDPFNPP
ncbi:hypothetical protein [Kamptonema sp. UHCC 0994]|uniref:hypothetical protein n=1 Tax=Kamptonema sp. UHCC 0994 TaxID=3031329 RepID=UPI0023B96F4D|nr:hypothetical protein [Kamptonema sp. UHCC 0994]MDF0553353.1 hypothetical protein [Kamptonema sp. UHCC 0994]